MNNSNNLDYFTLYIIFSIAFMLITLLVILIAKPSTGLGEVLVTINLLSALVWLAINLVNRLRERLVNHRDSAIIFQFLTVSMRLNGLLAVNAWIIEGKGIIAQIVVNPGVITVVFIYHRNNPHRNY